MVGEPQACLVLVTTPSQLYQFSGWLHPPSTTGNVSVISGALTESGASGHISGATGIDNIADLTSMGGTIGNSSPGTGSLGFTSSGPVSTTASGALGSTIGASGGVASAIGSALSGVSTAVDSGVIGCSGGVGIFAPIFAPYLRSTEGEFKNLTFISFCQVNLLDSLIKNSLKFDIVHNCQLVGSNPISLIIKSAKFGKYLYFILTYIRTLNSSVSFALFYFFSIIACL
ncbi:unnamed protein product [Protopolystoma xenopodis]|uniref:Uncharacterized protein n=1 Tax=Protopolystoma xenopodis TaxID=117903 RepID=A0A3S5A452_9PLAT|nr:unnamed protein product [Protopolystoma xenopodis]